MDNNINMNPEEEADSTETFSSSELDYTITTLVPDDIEQIINLTKKNTIYTDIYQLASLILTLNFTAIKSGDLILCYFGFIKYNEILPFLAKKCKKAIREIYSQNEQTILLYERILNLPQNIIYHGLSELIVNNNILVLSKCSLISGNEYKQICEDFYEYSRESLKLFPDKIEEIFFIECCLDVKMFCVHDVSYRCFLLDAECYARFMKKLRNEIKL